MKVKVCGITRYKDAAAALDEGADALGLNFFACSPRYVDPEEAHRIIRRLPAFAVSVGLFVNAASPAEVEATARHAAVQVLQLHGDESREYCRQLSDWAIVKAFRIGSDFNPEKLAGYPVRAFLLDARDDVLFGGTGKTFDWRLAAGITKLRSIVLAGGLNAQNVGEAIRIVQPYAIDVCGGVESSPGRKDRAKLREFMQAVRGARNS